MKGINLSNYTYILWNKKSGMRLYLYSGMARNREQDRDEIIIYGY